MTIFFFLLENVNETFVDLAILRASIKTTII